MKKLFYLILSIFIISLASCSSDDDSTSSQDGNLVGKWYSTEFIMEGTFIEDGITVSFEGVADDMPGNDVTFHSDNTFTANNAPFQMEIKFTAFGMPYTETVTMNSLMTGEGTWSKEGNKLIISEEETTEFTIETLSNTTLILTADQNSMTDFNEEMPENAEFSVTLTFTR